MPLVRDAIQQLGAAGSEIVTIFDFQDAFHTLRIALLSQKYLGITPYYGSPTYVYQSIGNGLVYITITLHALYHPSARSD